VPVPILAGHIEKKRPRLPLKNWKTPKNFPCGMKFSTCGKNFIPHEIFFVSREKFLGTGEKEKQLLLERKPPRIGRERPPRGQRRTV
jgi:hypothetical protein